MTTYCQGCGKECVAFGFSKFSSCCATGVFQMAEASSPVKAADFWDEITQMLEDRKTDPKNPFSNCYKPTPIESPVWHRDDAVDSALWPAVVPEKVESNWECLACGFKTGIIGDRGPEDGMFKMMRRAFLLHECKAPLEAAGKILDVPWQVTQPAYDLLWEQFGGDTPQETLTNALNYAMKKRSEDLS